MKRFACSGVLCVVAITAAACSSSSGSNGVAGQSSTQIISAVKQALSSASSVRVTGNIRQGSMQATFDLTTFSTGDFNGTINQGGASVKLVRIGTTDYLNASQSFWANQGAPAQTAQMLGGKWVYGTDKQIGLGNSFTLSSLSSQITTPKGTVTKGTTGTIDGQSALSLHSSQGTLWVATTGTTYPLELAKTGSNGGVVKFTAWNQGSSPSAPAGALSLNSLAS
jgi:hypothetical protein